MAVINRIGDFHADMTAWRRDIHKHPETAFEELRTSDLVAEKLGESPTNISHRLRRKFGMSYSEYVARIRVERAKQLFRRTRLNNTEVAQRVGIADQSNFAKLFKKIEGVTPTVYRKKHGKGL